MRRSVAIAPLAAVTTLVVACVTVSATRGSAPPVNACSSTSQCVGYDDAGAQVLCNGTFCQAQGGMVGNWMIVVTPAQTGFLGATYAIPFQQLIQPPNESSEAAAKCPPGTCAQLPPLVQVTGDLVCTPAAEQIADWNLGNQSVTGPCTGCATIPVQATFWPQWGTSNGDFEDATTLGIPLPFVAAPNLIDTGAGAVPGPALGPSIEFQWALPPLRYQQVLAPLPPFDAAYPPDVSTVDLRGGSYSGGQGYFNGFDTTSVGGMNVYPKFQLSRADGRAMNGWTAFLRDQTTLRTISNVATLAGPSATVQLLTSHHPAMGPGGTSAGNALAGTALVMQPPPSATEPLPTVIFEAPGGPPTQLAYPAVPAPITLNGTVTSKATGKPVAADITFDANIPTSTGLCYTPAGSTTAALDVRGDILYSVTVPADDGAYSATLPLGNYRVSIRPRGSDAQVTIVPYSLVSGGMTDAGTPECTLIPASSRTPLQADVQRVVTGTSAVADGRALVAANVEAVPAQCTDGSADLDCLPRPGSVTTADDGSFSLSLDAGVYVLRIRPAEGSNLPWKIVTPLDVPMAEPTVALSTVVVPAPIYAGLVLEDLGFNPVDGAVVRMFTSPAGGGPFLEIGQAMTGSDGHYDMYIDPTW